LRWKALDLLTVFHMKACTVSGPIAGASRDSLNALLAAKKTRKNGKKMRKTRNFSCSLAVT